VTEALKGKNKKVRQPKTAKTGGRRRQYQNEK